MKQEGFEISRIYLEIEKPHDESFEIRRTGNRDFRVAPHDNRIAMMTRMAPAPDGRFAHDHEGGDFVKDVVEPIAFECRSMAGFVPTRIRRGSINDPVNDKRQDGVPMAPPIITPNARP